MCVAVGVVALEKVCECVWRRGTRIACPSVDLPDNPPYAATAGSGNMPPPSGPSSRASGLWFPCAVRSSALATYLAPP